LIPFTKSSSVSYHRATFFIFSIEDILPSTGFTTSTLVSLGATTFGASGIGSGMSCGISVVHTFAPTISLALSTDGSFLG